MTGWLRGGILVLACSSVSLAQTWNENPKIYKYSVVPGGIWSQSEANDIGLEDVSIAQLRRPLKRYVSYIKEGDVYWTSEPLTIPAREYVWVHTGGLMFRARCGNSLSVVEQSPEEQLSTAPKPEEFDETLDLPEIEIPMQPFFDNDDVELPQTQIAKLGALPAPPDVPGLTEGVVGETLVLPPFAVYPVVIGGIVPVVETPPTPTPEPRVFGLVAVGLIAGGVLWRFKK